MWKVLNKEVISSFPWSCISGLWIMFESRISAGAVEKLPYSQNLCISSWSYVIKDHVKKYAKRYSELTNRTTQQLYKVPTPCIDDHHFKEEDLKFVGELSNVCSQIVLKYFYSACIGRPNILWSVNKLAQSITKWTRACDKTTISFDLLYSSHKWIQTILSSGNHCNKTPILQEILRI